MKAKEVLGAFFIAWEVFYGIVTSLMGVCVFCFFSYDLCQLIDFVITGLEGSDAGLVSVLESLEFCLKLRGSEACVLEDLAKAINLVHIRRDLVESGHSLLNHAYRAQQEYDR